MKNLLKVLLLAIVLALGIGEAFGQYVWTQDARNPILSGGASGTWNRNLWAPCVLFNTDSSRYEMWLHASSFYPSSTFSIGRATSKDGINWEMNPTPVLSSTPGTWDENWVQVPAVIRENGQYKMWYTSYRSIPPVNPYCIGLATSPDGIHWTKYSGNPVLGPGTAAWEAGGPYSCAVMSFPGGYKMWYAGSDSTDSRRGMGYATSVDGITWRRDTVHNPVLNCGATGQWDNPYMGLPYVLQIGNTCYMWYAGNRSGNGQTRSIGVATSKDTGKTWTKYPNNPLLFSSPGIWSPNDVYGGSVLRRGDTLDMWYAGSDNSGVFRIGHATSVVITGITERAGEVPQQFMLQQNYPNPFNPSTTIRYGLPNRSHVTLTVYNTLGQQTAILQNGEKEAGYHEVQFDGKYLSSGVYFYRIQAGDFVATKRLLLLR